MCLSKLSSNQPNSTVDGLINNPSYKKPQKALYELFLSGENKVNGIIYIVFKNHDKKPILYIPSIPLSSF